MAGRKNGLGRGLDAFFPDRTSVVKEPARKTITKTVKTKKSKTNLCSCYFRTVHQRSCKI